MEWDAIGAIGEVVGALAVVISLVYLAVQIRAQNKESRVSGMHEILAAFRDSIGATSNLEFADIFIRGNADFDSLSDAEKYVLIAGLQRILRVWEEAFLQYQAGRLDERIWNVMVKQYSAVMGGQSAANVWVLRRDYYDAAFRAFVDTIKVTEYRTK